jgi:hypothetical protein
VEDNAFAIGNIDLTTGKRVDVKLSDIFSEVENGGTAVGSNEYIRDRFVNRIIGSHATRAPIRIGS